MPGDVRIRLFGAAPRRASRVRPGTECRSDDSQDPRVPLRRTGTAAHRRASHGQVRHRPLPDRAGRHRRRGRPRAQSDCSVSSSRTSDGAAQVIAIDPVAERRDHARRPRRYGARSRRRPGLGRARSDRWIARQPLLRSVRSSRCDHVCAAPHAQRRHRLVHRAAPGWHRPRHGAADLSRPHRSGGRRARCPNSGHRCCRCSRADDSVPRASSPTACRSPKAPRGTACSTHATTVCSRSCSSSETCRARHAASTSSSPATSPSSA